MRRNLGRFSIGIKIVCTLGFLIILTMICKELFTSYTPTLKNAMSMSLKVHEDENIYHGTLKNLAFPQFCLDSLYNKMKHNEIGVRHCPVDRHDPPENQNWALTKTQYLRRPKGGCLEGTRWGLVQMTNCNENNNRLYWTYDSSVKLLFEHFSRKCLEIDPKEQKVYLMNCNAVEPRQKWDFTYHNSGKLVQLVEYSDYAEQTMIYE